MQRRRLLGLSIALTVAVVAGGCGGDDDARPSITCRTAVAGRVDLVAKGVAWDTDCLEAPPGPLTIVVDNRDVGVNHNLHLTDAPELPKTPLQAGPVVQELAVTLEAGTYQYVCDIHPNMVGTLRVAAAT